MKLWNLRRMFRRLKLAWTLWLFQLDFLKRWFRRWDTCSSWCFIQISRRAWDAFEGFQSFHWEIWTVAISFLSLIWNLHWDNLFWCSNQLVVSFKMLPMFLCWWCLIVDVSWIKLVSAWSLVYYSVVRLVYEKYFFRFIRCSPNRIRSEEPFWTKLGSTTECDKNCRV